MTSMRHALVAAALVTSGLSLAPSALACPGAKKAPPAPVAAEASPHTECAYSASQRSRSCCGSSLASKALVAGVPAGLIAFGLGWLSGGRRRRNDQA